MRFIALKVIWTIWSGPYDLGHMKHIYHMNHMMKSEKRSKLPINNMRATTYCESKIWIPISIWLKIFHPDSFQPICIFALFRFSIEIFFHFIYLLILCWYWLKLRPSIKFILDRHCCKRIILSHKFRICIMQMV